MMKNLITILGLVLLIAFGYYLFVLQDQDLNAGNRAVTSQAQFETQSFLVRLQAIQSINLRTDVLSDPRFTNRVDNSEPVPTLPVGKDDPFSPIF